MAVELRAIARDNWYEIIELKPRDDQAEFVATNAYSMAQAAYQPECVPLGIYVGQTPVGFLMYAFSPHNDHWWIYRLMIDQRYQGRGYGRAAMEQVLAILRAKPNPTDIMISFAPENTVAQNLYSSLGFVSTGEMWDAEIVYRLAANKEDSHG